MSYEQVKEKLSLYGQEHLLKFYPELNEIQKEHLLQQIDDLDMSILELINQKRENRDWIEPLETLRIDDINKKKHLYHSIGIDALKHTKVGAVLLAGGHGTRLGVEKRRNVMKRIAGLLFICLFMLCFLYPKHVNAATTELEPDKTYQADLDGDGEEETIEYKTKMTDTKNTLTIYINGKKKYTHSDSYPWPGQVCITDLSEEDQRQEIFYEFVIENGGFEYCRFLRYENKKLKTAASADWKQKIFASAVELAPNQKGDGSVTLCLDTPFLGKGGLGSYYVDMEYVIEDEKLVKVEQPAYEVSEYWADQPYTLKKKTSFMKVCGGKKKAFTLKKGEQIYLTQVSGSKDNDTVYAEFRTDAGRRGWIEITDVMFYKEAYGWG